MTDSIHPHRSEFEALKSSIDERFAEQNIMILGHNEASTRRDNRQEKTVESLRDSMQTVADKLNAMVKDYSDTKRAMQKQDLDHAEEKGEIMAKLAKQEQAIHEKLNKQDLAAVQQNGEIAKINAKLNEILPVVSDFKEAARVILDEQKERKRSDEKTQKLVQSALTYSKLILSLGGVVALIFAALAFVSNHVQLKEPAHESASPKSSRLKKVRSHVLGGRYAWRVRGDGQNASGSVFYIA